MSDIKDKILLNTNNNNNIKENMIIKMVEKYNNISNDKIFYDTNTKKRELLKSLINKYSSMNEKDFNKIFITNNDLIYLINRYNKNHTDKISYNNDDNYDNLLLKLKNKFTKCTDNICLLNEINRKNLNKKKIKEFTKDEYKKCAPNINYEDNSCLSKDKLLEMANIYNEKFKNDKTYKMIDLPNDISKSELVKELSKRLSTCNNQICWLSKIYDNSAVKNNILTYFRPPGPETRFKWLNTTNINLVMEQYEKKYKDFKFFGAVPIDFDIIYVSDILTINYLDLINQGINRIGFIFNLDRHNQSGSHWVALYCDLIRKQIYFFDSYGTNPFRDLKYNNIAILMARIANYLNKSLDENFLNIINNIKDNYIIERSNILAYSDNNIENFDSFYKNNKKIINNSGYFNKDNMLNNINNFDIKFANIRHQFENSECGVYSIYFILNMLLDPNNFYKLFYDKNIDINETTNNKNHPKRIYDNQVNQCRDEYFNFADLLIVHDF